MDAGSTKAKALYEGPGGERFFMLSDTAGLTRGYDVRAGSRRDLDHWLQDNGFRLVKAGRTALEPPRQAR